MGSPRYAFTYLGHNIYQLADKPGSVRIYARWSFICGIYY